MEQSAGVILKLKSVILTAYGQQLVLKCTVMKFSLVAQIVWKPKLLKLAHACVEVITSLLIM